MVTEQYTTKDEFAKLTAIVKGIQDNMDTLDGSVALLSTLVERINHLGNMKDVTIQYITEGDILQYSSDGTWHNIAANVLSGGGLSTTTEEVVKSLINTEGSKLFIRKDVDDTAKGAIEFKSNIIVNKHASLKEGATFGSFNSGLIGGTGAKIDKDGNSEMTSLTLRDFLQVPELRYNRVDVVSGELWNSIAFGTIESVDTTSTTVTLKLEDGEYSGIHVGDICRGIFHNIDSDNNTESTTDENGFEQLPGFTTAYFTPIEILDDHGKQFKYELKPNTTQHPTKAMKFVVYGNFTDTTRQASAYATRTYKRYLKGVSTWAITVNNIASLFGNLDGLVIDGAPNDGQLEGDGAYLTNVYMTGSIIKFTPEQLEELKGLDGKDGTNGKDGKDGVDGVDGKDGKTAYTYIINPSNFNIRITSTDTYDPSAATFSLTRMWIGDDNSNNSDKPNAYWVCYADNAENPTTAVKSTDNSNTFTVDFSTVKRTHYLIACALTEADLNAGKYVQSLSFQAVYDGADGSEVNAQYVILRSRGIYDSTKTYYYSPARIADPDNYTTYPNSSNCRIRDYINYKGRIYFVKAYNETSGITNLEPSLSSTYWSVSSYDEIVATNTLLADNAKLGDFNFSNSVFTSANGKLSMDSNTGKLIANNCVVNGYYQTVFDEVNTDSFTLSDKLNVSVLRNSDYTNPQIITLPSDASFIGKRVCISNTAYPPYSRNDVGTTVQIDSIAINKNIGICGVDNNESFTSRKQVKNISVLGGVVELLAVPMEYGNSTNCRWVVLNGFNSIQTYEYIES